MSRPYDRVERGAIRAVPSATLRCRESAMHPENLFQIHLVAGYAAWLLCFGAYVWPWLKSMERDQALRAIATLHSFRFFGLVFILPGVVGSGLPAGFGAPTAWGDFATGL